MSLHANGRSSRTPLSNCSEVLDDLACALPAEPGVPLSRWSSAELAREAVTRGICDQISGVTVWRWLSADAIKLWQQRSWIFLRDPRFAERAGPILDLYLYQGR